MTTSWSPSPRTRPPLAPPAPLSRVDPPAWPSAQGAYGQAGAARPGAVGAGGTPAGRVRGRMGAGLDVAVCWLVAGGWWSVVGGMLALLTAGVALGVGCVVAGWLLS